VTTKEKKNQIYYSVIGDSFSYQTNLQTKHTLY